MNVNVNVNVASCPLPVPRRPFFRPVAIAGAVLLAAAVATAMAAGCVDDFKPEVGPPLASSCGDGDSNPAAAVSFASDIAPLLADMCSRCHTPGGAAPVGLEIGGLDVSSYSTLRAGGVVSGTRIVVDGQPCASALVQKLRPEVPFGARMPLNGPPFLDADKIQLVHDWIAEGAREN
jgi:hypothetical protein